jgi:hypothetical protein
MPFRQSSKKSLQARYDLKKIRDAIANLVTDPDWIILRAEFEAGALRSESIRRAFVEVHRQQIRDGGKRVPRDHGLAVTQKLFWRGTISEGHTSSYLLAV